MIANQYPCCEHCKDDQPHIEADTHSLPCDIDGCQVTIREDMSGELDRLRAEVARLQGIEQLAITEVDRLRAEVERMRPVIEAAVTYDHACHGSGTLAMEALARATLLRVVLAYRAAVAALDAGEPT